MLDPDDREIKPDVLGDDLAESFLAVEQFHFDEFCTFDDRIIGHY